MITRVLSWAGLLLVAGGGAVLGGWITNKQDPVQFLSREVLTPVVRPGDDVKIELDNYRVLRCPQTTYRIINKPDGERSVQTDDKPAAFGKLGRDKYIASVPTPSSTPFGKATIYSYTVRMCNPWEWMFPASTPSRGSTSSSSGPRRGASLPNRRRTRLRGSRAAGGACCPLLGQFAALLISQYLCPLSDPSHGRVIQNAECVLPYEGTYAEPCPCPSSSSTCDRPGA
ncbi:hypothetical protein [Methylorubrum extorquens]|uniref:hypothetical protein n=1 Tax=Methylorubrum extorquens TaxID=408 RepID=UPI0001629985|nr:hypothetical protein [Methylorubrum extorquens]ABY31912.1 hypothetical protein Mext_3529 [Methylorubrum extorquens PA1]